MIAPTPETWEIIKKINTKKDIANLIDVLKEAGDVIECYHKNTGIDLGYSSRMPFYDETIRKIDDTIASMKQKYSLQRAEDSLYCEYLKFMEKSYVAYFYENC